MDNVRTIAHQLEEQYSLRKRIIFYNTRLYFVINEKRKENIFLANLLLVSIFDMITSAFSICKALVSYSVMLALKKKQTFPLIL